MPFINDKLDTHRDEALRAQLAREASRASRFRFDPNAVAAQLKAAIIGQDAVLSALQDLVDVLKADISEPERPLSVNLLVGPTGVGKTETVKVLAKALTGSDQYFCRIDMNTLAQGHYSAAITGAPPGYVGSKEGHSLFDAAAIEGQFSYPGVVLFDEIEKASDEVLRSLLNVFDTGILRLTGGNKTISFRNTLIFMTSNLGARELVQWRSQPWRFWRRWPPFECTPEMIVDRAIRQRFDPEFINRIERRLLFNYLPKYQLGALIDREMVKLNQRLATKGAALTLADTAKAQLASLYSEEYGARNLTHHIRTQLLPLVARALLAKPKQNTFTLNWASGQFTIE